jgi:hypothetical protein
LADYGWYGLGDSRWYSIARLLTLGHGLITKAKLNLALEEGSDEIALVAHVSIVPQSRTIVKGIC